MASVTVPFGEWLPDAPTFQNPGLEVADNVIPRPGGYGPQPGLLASGDTVTDTVKGAQLFYRNNGDRIICGGTDDSLFIRLDSGVTETAGMTSTGTGNFWDFARFNDFVVATAANNSPQYLSDIDTDTSWSALPGSPPAMRYCAKVNEFLVLGNSSANPNRIQWSRYNDPTSTWGTSRLNQSGLADLDSDLGAVRRIIGGRYAMVFQRRGIQRLSYVGPPVVFRADVIERDRGLHAPFSTAVVGYFVFFLAQDGFYVTNGSAVQPIGNSRVNQWFFDNVNQNRINSTHAAVDWRNESVVWGFYSSTQTTRPDRFIRYSWALDRWATGTVDHDWLVGSGGDGIDIDSIDGIYGDLDSIPGSLDAAEFRPSADILSAWDANEYKTFASTPLAATFETGEAQPAPGRRVFISGVLPHMVADSWDATASLKMRDNRGAQTASAVKTCGWDGRAHVRGEGRRVAVVMTKPAGTEWSEATGADVEYTVAGER